MHLTPFVGRGAELEVLGDALADAAGGDCRMVVVAGEAGVGKSRLVERFAIRAASADATVLRGACVDTGPGLRPYGPFRAMVSGIDRDTLAESLPADVLAQASADPLRSGEWSVELLAALAEGLCAVRPLVLVVDDLHWADASTPAALGFLVRTLPDARLLIVATYRTDDLHRTHPLRAFLAELDRLPQVRRLDLARFDRAETGELVGAALGTPAAADLLDRVYDRSGGNAFFVEEIAEVERSGDRALPDTLRDLLLARVEMLPAPARQVAALAAVGGQRVNHPLLAEVAGLPEADLLAGLRASVAAYVMRAEPDGTYTFRHALTREAILGDLLVAERRAAHRRYAETLAARPELAGPGQAAAELARHWDEADDAGNALPALVRAAVEAGAGHARAEQARLLRRALARWPDVPDAAARVGVDRLRLLEEAVKANIYAGHLATALEYVDDALGEVDRAAEPERAAVLLSQRGRVLFNLERADAVGTLERARAVCPDAPSLARVAVLDRLALGLVIATEPGRAREIATEAATMADRLGETRWIASARITLGTALMGCCEHDAALAELDRARGVAAEHDHLSQLWRAYRQLAEVSTHLGRHRDAERAARAALPIAWRVGRARTTGVSTYGGLATALLAQGRWREAGEVIRRGLELEAEGVYGRHLHLSGIQLALVRDDPAAARRHLTILRGRVLRERDPALRYARLAAELALREGRTDDAVQSLDTVLSLANPPGLAGELWPLLTVAARAMRQPEQHDRLRDLAAGLPSTAPAWAAHAAQLTAETSPPDDVGSWLAAVAAWERTEQPYDLGYARLRAAASAAAAGRRELAAAQLSGAADLAAGYGAVWLQRQARDLARRANIGLPGSARDVAGDDRTAALTRRELEVLRLLSLGRTNRGIGAELFISPKTASVHVSNILSKLGVGSRLEAAALAHRLNLFDT